MRRILLAAAVAREGQRAVIIGPDTDPYVDWIARKVRQRDRLFAPDLLPHELASIVHREYGPVASEYLPDLMQRIVSTAMEGIRLEEVAWARTWPWVGQLSHYDATYLALAIVKEAMLVTFDRKLTEVARRHVQVIGSNGLD